MTYLLFNLYYHKDNIPCSVRQNSRTYKSNATHPHLIIFQRSQRLYYICNKIMDIVKRKFLFSCLLTGCMSCDTSPPSRKNTRHTSIFIWYILIPASHKQNLLWHYGESVICLVILFMCMRCH